MGELISDVLAAAAWVDLDPEAEAKLQRQLTNTVFRGQHSQSDEIETRLKTISFGSEKAATTYALIPNDYREVPVSPKVFEARLRPVKPFAFSDPEHEDPFIDLDILVNCFPAGIVEAVIRDCRGSIENTSSYIELQEKTDLDIWEMLNAYKEGHLRTLPIVEAFAALEVPELHQALIDMGVDLVVIGGSGATACELEYHVLNPAIIDILSVEHLAQASVEPEPSLSGV